MTADDDIIDTTSLPVEEGAKPIEALNQADPTMAVVVALSNELQKVYANDPAKLTAATKTLRGAFKPKQ